MVKNNFLNTAIWILVGVVALVLAIVFIKHISDFLIELRYVNHEIQRTHGVDRQHYLRRRRRLWLSTFLFIPYRWD